MSLKNKSFALAAAAVAALFGAIVIPAMAPKPFAPEAHAQAAATQPPAVRGATLFRARCGSCHSVAPGAKGQGPNLAGVIGRRAATQAGYTYSRGMLAANRAWSPTTLDAFLTAPARAVPGTRMMASVTNPADRAAVIAYLQTTGR
jgi:cytochrome c